MSELMVFTIVSIVSRMSCADSMSSVQDGLFAEAAGLRTFTGLHAVITSWVGSAGWRSTASSWGPNESTKAVPLIAAGRRL